MNEQEGMKISRLFRKLQQQEVAAVMARLQPVRYKQGERILERGVWHGRLYMIGSGRVSVLLEDVDREGSAPVSREEHPLPGQEAGEAEHSERASYVVARLGPGECFGEMSLITGDPPSASVRAETETMLWSLTHQDFMALVSWCPTLLSNINAILAQRLARMNQQIHSVHTAERTWLSLVETPGNPLEQTIVFHIADALAVRSQRRVLLIDLSEQYPEMIPHFATHSGQARPSLLECERDHALLHYHLAPTTTIAGQHYAAMTTLLPMPSLEVSPWKQVSNTVEIRSLLAYLASFYDYLLLVTARPTPPVLVEAAAEDCTRAILLISSHEVGRKARNLSSSTSAESHLAVWQASMAGQDAGKYAIFVTQVHEAATIEVQDHYASRLGHEVTRLLPADTALLEESWKQRAALHEVAPHAALSQAVDFVARHIAHQTVGVAFGGGGARGFAHIGAFQRLLQFGIPVDYVAGCSIGIIPPGLYLMGMSFSEIEALFLDIQRHIMHWGFPRSSIFSNRRLQREIRKLCGETRFEDLSTPFAMVAVDLAAREEVVLERGALWLAALASVSIPGVFPPVVVKDHILVDAGIHDPVPTRVLRRMGADILLALDLHGREPLTLKSATPWLTEGQNVPGRQSAAPHLVDTLLRAYEVGMSAISMHSDLEADLVIRPQTHGVALLQFAKGAQLVNAGREAVEQSIPTLKKLFPWL